VSSVGGGSSFRCSNEPVCSLTLRRCAYIATRMPSRLRWTLEETKPAACRTKVRVTSARSSTSRACFAGSTVNTLMNVTTSASFEIVVIALRRL
jgi:hypothetical protein